MSSFTLNKIIEHWNDKKGLTETHGVFVSTLPFNLELVCREIDQAMSLAEEGLRLSCSCCERGLYHKGLKCPSCRALEGIEAKRESP